jgi:hypothetical protein
LREFGEHCSPPQKRVALASATLSDSSILKIAFGDFPRASSINQASHQELSPHRNPPEPALSGCRKSGRLELVSATYDVCADSYLSQGIPAERQIGPFLTVQH